MNAELWTMAELAGRVAGALSSGYGGQHSRRVSDVPDPRAIRYYTTLGLVDRPAVMRGRTALYGSRHLWQLVAIKRLQAEGRTLAEIQQELAGAPDGTLRRLAAIPDEGFWRRTPAPDAGTASSGTASSGTASSGTVSSDAGTVTSTEIASPAAYQAVPLEDGAVVLIPRRDTLTDSEIAALRAAAGPLNALVARLKKGQP